MLGGDKECAGSSAFSEMTSGSRAIGGGLRMDSWGHDRKTPHERFCKYDLEHRTEGKRTQQAFVDDRVGPGMAENKMTTLQTKRNPTALSSAKEQQSTERSGM